MLPQIHSVLFNLCHSFYVQVFDQWVWFAGPGEKGNTKRFLGDCMKNEVMIFSSFLFFGTGFITRSITSKKQQFVWYFYS